MLHDDVKWPIRPQDKCPVSFVLENPHGKIPFIKMCPRGRENTLVSGLTYSVPHASV